MTKKGQGFARRVTASNLSLFAPFLILPLTRGTSRASQTGRGEGPAAPIAAEDLFSGTPARWPVPFKRIGRLRKAAKEGAPVKRDREPAATAGRGMLLWRKVLKASDVQQQRGNPTGGLRLTQAKFEVNGRTIDQTTYFRHTLFGMFSWILKRATPRVEATTIPFDVTIPGKSYGVYTLEISDKPSGEAGQGNYTSILHWGPLAQIVRKLPLKDRTVTFYGPPPGTSAPYFLEIA